MDQKSPGTSEVSDVTVFLAGVSHGFSLFLYDNDDNRFTVMRHFISHAVGQQVKIIYAYYSTTLIAPFKKEITGGDITLFELRNGLDQLESIIADHCHEGTEINKRLCIVIDFSRNVDIFLVISLLQKIKKAMACSVHISGVISYSINNITLKELQQIRTEIPSVIVLSDNKNILAFTTADHAPEISGILPQDIVESVVKHSLEPLILMHLDRAVSGIDIIHNISDRFHVEIPLARVYSYLYNMEDKGLVTTELRGRSKIYIPTESGRLFIRQRLQDLHAAHEYILGYYHDLQSLNK